MTTDTYTIRLDNAPTSSVTITLDWNPLQIAVDGPSLLGTGNNRYLTFTPINWATPQTVEVIAIQDDLPEGPHTTNVSHTATSADTRYNALSIRDVVVNITEPIISPPVPTSALLTFSGGSPQIQVTYTNGTIATNVPSAGQFSIDINQPSFSVDDYSYAQSPKQYYVYLETKRQSITGPNRTIITRKIIAFAPSTNVNTSAFVGAKFEPYVYVGESGVTPSTTQNVTFQTALQNMDYDTPWTNSGLNEHNDDRDWLPFISTTDITEPSNLSGIPAQKVNLGLIFYPGSQILTVPALATDAQFYIGGSTSGGQDFNTVIEQMQWYFRRSSGGWPAGPWRPVTTPVTYAGSGNNLFSSITDVGTASQDVGPF